MKRISLFLLCSIAANSYGAGIPGIDVTGDTISWDDSNGGWMQVQDESDYSAVCEGNTFNFCVVDDGSYKVTNHSATVSTSTSGIVVSTSGSRNGIEVTGCTISWPDDGWYQVQDEATYNEVCGGGSSCEIVSGSLSGPYKVTNHSTGEALSGVTVPASCTSSTYQVFDAAAAQAGFELRELINYDPTDASGALITAPTGGASYRLTTPWVDTDGAYAGNSDLPVVPLSSTKGNITFIGRIAGTNNNLYQYDASIVASDTTVDFKWGRYEQAAATSSFITAMVTRDIFEPSSAVSGVTLSPVAGATLTGSSQEVSVNNLPSGEVWGLWGYPLGTNPAVPDDISGIFFDSGLLVATGSDSITVTGIPTNGSNIVLRIAHGPSGGPYSFVPQQYVAASQGVDFSSMPLLTTVPISTKASISAPALSASVASEIANISMIRVSNDEEIHSYATRAAITKDNVNVILPGDFNAVVRNIATGAAVTIPGMNTEVEASNVDPDIIWGVSGGKVRKGSIMGAISEEWMDAEGSTQMGNFEGGISEDDRYMVANNGNDLKVIDLKAKTIVGRHTVSNLNGFRISQDGSYVSWLESEPLSLHMATRTFTEVQDTGENSYHGDWCVNTDGDQVFVKFSTAQNKIDMVDAVTKQIVTLNVGTNLPYTGHISCRNFGRPGWAYISSYKDERLFALRLDKSGPIVIQDWGFHREPGPLPLNSDGTEADYDYKDVAKATVSHDGTMFMYTTRWENSSTRRNYINKFSPP